MSWYARSEAAGRLQFSVRKRMSIVVFAFPHSPITKFITFVVQFDAT